MNLLEINDLALSFPSTDGRIRVIDGIHLSIEPGQTHCLVGESGCGKSLTARAILNLLPPTAQIERGAIHFNGTNLLTCSKRELRTIRGGDIGTIFQDPMNSLNPVFTCGDQVRESLQIHRGYTPREAQKKTVELFDLVRIPSPELRTRQYPHELSGGMRQRVMIAMALACEPKLLIADEPTTALDVTVQDRILSVLSTLRKELNIAILFITHDLGVVSRIGDVTTVLYAGRNCEYGATESLLKKPLHPYTQGLLRAVPRLTTHAEELLPIPGSIADAPLGAQACLFASRCPHCMAQCSEATPREVLTQGHRVSCVLYEEEK
ncbi:ABC transporter ATP-binding protein [Chitinivibrio alkaliphilus]|uniref:ABC-type dipeptide/oligopeptide/nickel transport system, ATPase component n=1 Tax=Chitinivibrio alkaliphilus ACht1 TaxID=1313304 RepID=U7DAQ8_9BACT|nr:ABC transporter ATP-binding protein [Chitinivibrio alkaliphilus]ERP32212.1 ABC-type dipeptide/oligopeptide/nickel transport system, ATPase component [Chitinivibrio alkaliphilus ACht1]